ncbi:Diacylglycerol kinase1 isoform 1 [Hibiscus syriacus]|uniref:Diacylglycerol kinase1 isoform 1 n=1 Tax=Hibiscus syriacus TaxID=106335 RepID=A0A6A3CP00_HIBSY|nr:Diacylglycerol kinase1 isoform 1 [Hibiscus syriacus]
MALNLPCLISMHSKPENLPFKEKNSRHLFTDERNVQGKHPASHPEIPKEMQLTYASPTYDHIQTLDPIARLSPRKNGSTLYDSYELQAVSYQLNKAMQLQRLSCSSPAYLCYLKSPLYSQCFSREDKKKVLCSHLTCAAINRNAASNMRTKKVAGGFAAKLWNKIKQRLLRSNIKLRKDLRDA